MNSWRRPWFWLSTGLLGWVGLSLLWAQPPLPAVPTPPAAAQQAEEDVKMVDLTADVIRPVKIRDSSAISLVGHVVFHHNGAVITCDSAIRYSDRRIDCYRNVIINRDSVFIYGDQADYNDSTHIARVYAPLVKMVDKDAVLYTYNFSFNTLDKIAHYTGGGTLLQGENRLESEEGFYYVDERILVGVRNAEMENPDYRLQSDSVRYNLDTEVASFFTRTHIWNSKDEFLTALQGTYDRKASLYTFYDGAYVLTGTQEIWADTLTYNQQSGDALLLGNAQVVDEEQQGMAFGDYIRYWGQERKALLTRRPVVASYEEQEEGKETRDTLFLRSDTMWIFSVNRYDTLPADSLRIDSLKEDLPEPAKETPAVDPQTEELLKTTADQPTDAKAQRALRKKQQVLEKQQRTLEKQQAREAKRKAREETKRSKRRVALEKLKRSAEQASRDSLARVDSLRAQAIADSLARQLPVDTLPPTVDSVAAGDSLVRQLFAYHNVRMFRRDFQAVCDSLTAFTIDSMIHMYIKPVMWNENNQVTSVSVDIYTRNQAIDKVVYVGDPIMSSEVMGTRYNQIKGKVIEAYFHEGAIARMDVNGNGQTYYYMEDEDDAGKYLSGFMTVESAAISFYFEEGEVVNIAWRGQPNFFSYPMEKIPANVSQTLPGFSWEAQRRPVFEDVFDRTMRPSERVHYEALEKPAYPITEKINRDRERLTKEGLWRDRNDPLSAEAVEFLRTLLP